MLWDNKEDILRTMCGHALEEEEEDAGALSPSTASIEHE